MLVIFFFVWVVEIIICRVLFFFILVVVLVIFGWISNCNFCELGFILVFGGLFIFVIVKCIWLLVIWVILINVMFVVGFIFLNFWFLGKVIKVLGRLIIKVLFIVCRFGEAIVFFVVIKIIFNFGFDGFRCIFCICINDVFWFSFIVIDGDGLLIIFWVFRGIVIVFIIILRAIV